MDIIDYIIDHQFIVIPEVDKRYILIFDNEKEFVETYIKLNASIDSITAERFYNRCDKESDTDKVCIRISILRINSEVTALYTGYGSLEFYKKTPIDDFYNIIEHKRFDLESALKYVK